MTVGAEPKSVKGAMLFGFALLCFAFIWLVAFPWLGRTAPVRGLIDRNQQSSIDPTALFYTDIEHLHYQRGMLRREPPRDNLNIEGH